MDSAHVPELTYHRTVSALLDIVGSDVGDLLSSTVLNFRAKRPLAVGVVVHPADEVSGNAFEFWIPMVQSGTFGAFYVEYRDHPLVFFAYRANAQRLKRDEELIDWAQNGLNDCLALFDQTHAP